LIHRVLDCPEERSSLPEVLAVSEELYGEIERSAAYHLERVRAGTKSLKFPQERPSIEAEGKR
ncbi:MAG: hypothetical protein JW820_01730, partial [Spirochaetales bacterium]|nr:hypothetical protein [Spirochaetales bacterium]